MDFPSGLGNELRHSIQSLDPRVKSSVSVWAITTVPPFMDKIAGRVKARGSQFHPLSGRRDTLK